MHENAIIYNQNGKCHILGSQKITIASDRKSLFMDKKVILSHEELIVSAQSIDNFIVFKDIKEVMYVYNMIGDLIFKRKCPDRFKLLHMNEIPYIMYIVGPKIIRINLFDQQSEEITVKTKVVEFDVLENQYIVCSDNSVCLFKGENIVKLDNYVKILSLKVIPDGFAIVCTDNAVRVYNNGLLRYILNTDSQIVDLGVLTTEKDYKIVSVCSQTFTVWY